MPDITFQQQRYPLLEGESVLDGLLRQGVSVPSSCRSGICHSCMMHAELGTPPPAAQQRLKEAQRELGYFLGCQCIPTEDMEVALPGDEEWPLQDCALMAKEPLGHDLVRLRLHAPPEFDYRAGQFINLHRNTELVRSYSLASTPSIEEYLELHIQRVANGRMSEWLCDEAVVGATLRIQGPLGDCYYHPGHPDQPMLLIGTGSGLAPLWGIVRDALLQGHHAPIHLYHGCRAAAGLYLVEELQSLAAEHTNFFYHPCVSGSQTPDQVRAGRANDMALADHAQLKGWQVYLCGNADMVKQTKMKAFLAGAALGDIHADPFEFSHNAGQPDASKAAPAARSSVGS